MASISFRVRSKANKKAAIKIRVSIDRQNVFETNTGFSIHPKNWSSETGLPKQTTAENKQIQSNLKKLDAFVWENLNADSGGSVIIDQFWLEEKVASCFNRIEKTDIGLLVHYLQELIDNAATRKVKVPGGYKMGISKSRVNSFIATKNVIVEYQAIIKKQLHFLDLSETTVDKFTNWLLVTKKYAINTASKFVANIKTISREAERKGIPVHPFAKYIEVFSESDDDRYIQTLSFAEQKQILDTHFEREALKNAKKWLLIGCEIGQRAEDLLILTKKNVRYKDGRMFMDIFQEKTNKRVTVGVAAPHIIDIIENDFPYEISDQKFNDYIKEVCETAGINEMVEGKIFDALTDRKLLGTFEKYKLITSHCCRRSFATNYYRKMQTSVLMKITGHSRESIFLRYINQRENQDDNAELFIRLHEEIHRVGEPQLQVV
ncbi:tyrosine-type recombinase/integrase [Flavobacterium caeni]|uniref:Phage integrase family protein n=1 Tax=Flavobacterium caeni TaxID=490189 RepID=A0A1G5EF66_9FLAO|nr:tyrosine-type recombinase/integrase [Flavobacterium caeni]SCY25629.1 Phage integrase family protein [Flavobacterium caeni]